MLTADPTDDNPECEAESGVQIR